MEQNITERTKTLISLIQNSQMQKEINELFKISFSAMGPRSEKSNERVYFSVIKCAMESIESFSIAKELYKTDIRDLFMHAGFGYDTYEHESWYEQKLNEIKTNR